MKKQVYVFTGGGSGLALAPRIVDNGSITIISSAGGFGWEQSYALCKQVIACRTYEETIQWYEQHPETYAVQDVFLKKRSFPVTNPSEIASTS
jgi:hypothetical protein